MKKDKNKDELDDFLEGNLSSYSEDPPDHLWGAIESGLPASGGTSAAFAGRTIGRWWFAAAAAVMLGLFTCQHFYYHQRLNDLQALIQQQSPNAPSVAQQTNKSIEETPTTLPDHADNQTGRPDRIKPEEQGDRATIWMPESPVAVRLESARGSTFGENQTGIQRNSERFDLPAAPALETTSGLSEAGINGETNASSNIQPLRDLQWSTVSPIPGIALSLEVPALQIDPVARPVKPSAGKGKWSVFAHTSFMTEKARVTESRTLPGPGGPKVFQEDRTAKGPVLFVGLGAERAVNRYISLLSGLDYHQVTLNAEHKVKLKFGDREPHGPGWPGGPGGPHSNHGFTYQVNTSSGAMKVDVRVSEVDSSIQIPDQEDIGLAIKRSETTQYLTIPLLAKFQVGRKRLHLTVKGGLLTDILLRNENSITGISSLNPRFRIESGAPPRTTKADLNPVTFSYLAAAGLEYRITPALSLQVEPTLIGGLSPRQTDADVTVSRLATGLNAGLRLQF